MNAPKNIHFTDGMAWGDRRSYAGEQGPPFRWVPEPLPKPRVSGGFWRGFVSVVVFYAIGAAILVEIFRPAWVQNLLRVMGVH